jgi:hypothetical protein
MLFENFSSPGYRQIFKLLFGWKIFIKALSKQYVFLYPKITKISWFLLYILIQVLFVTKFIHLNFFPCSLSILEEPSFDPCYPIRAVRGKTRWEACLQSIRLRFNCSVSIGQWPIKATYSCQGVRVLYFLKKLKKHEIISTENKIQCIRPHTSSHTF